MFFGEEKRYVTPQEGRNQFPGDIAVWTYCARCSAPILIPKDGSPFCSGIAGACTEPPEWNN
jgi:hypothetical protein